MSRPSQRQQMRDALETVERGLGSLIAARYENGTAGLTVDIMTMWRNMARRSLGHIVEDRECICPRCGIRHGLKPTFGDF